MAARGLIVGFGRVFNLSTNTPYPVQAGATFGASVGSIQVPAGSHPGTINISTSVQFSGQFGFRESAPEVWQDIYGGTIATGAAQDALKLHEEIVAASTDALTLSFDVAASLTGTDRTGVIVTPIGGSPLTVVTTSPGPGEVQYTIGSPTLTLDAAEFADGTEFEVAYLHAVTAATSKTWTPSPTAIPQPLHLLFALRLHEPYQHLDIGSGVTIELASCVLDGEAPSIGAPIADVVSHAVNFRAQNFITGDIRVGYHAA